MNSRERISAAFEHKEADRIPLDLSGHRSSGISALAYARLRDYLGFPRKPIRVYDPIQQLAVVDEDVLERFGVDTIELGRAFALQDDSWVEWALPDGTPCQMPVWAVPERKGDHWVFRSKGGRVIGHMPQGALYFEQCYYPFAEDEADYSRLPEAFAESMWNVVASPPGPLVAGPDGPGLLAERARKLRETTPRAILGLFGGNLLETGQFLFRNDNFLMMLAAEADRVHDFLEKLVAFHLTNLERFLAAVGPHIDIIVFGDDLGSQKGSQISPCMYREFFKPRHQMMWKRAKELANVKVMLHCCGGVRELLPDLIEAGLDAINPVQITCRGMETRQLKADFGKDIVFWGGGCDTRSVLPYGTPEEVRRHVKRQIELLSPGGGFVFQQVHNIMADVAPQNVVAMLDAVNA